MSNKYYFRSQISDRKFRLILRLFSLDIEAKKVAEFVGMNRGSINNIYNKFRELIGGGDVVDYENYAREIPGMSKRPYDLNHTNKIKTVYSE